MITVDALSKSYGSTHALKNISFSVTRGEIIGILGSNGAGKSTLIKLLAGYLPASSGSVTVDGMDLVKQSLEVRRRLGYLPENNPLYPEMRVREYIAYRAALKEVPARRVAEKVIDVFDLCGLRSMERKLIGTLSKGYRQRVGLADALVNEPALLLLDEPTLGLDQHQQRHIFSLIKGLAERHTVLFSTHLLSEAELICDRLLILHHGKMVALGTPKELRHQYQQENQMMVLEMNAPDTVRALSFLQELPGVQTVSQQANTSSTENHPWKTFHLLFAPHEEVLDHPEVLISTILTAGWSLRSFSKAASSLKESIAALTLKEEQ